MFFRKGDPWKVRSRFSVLLNQIAMFCRHVFGVTGGRRKYSMTNLNELSEPEIELVISQSQAGRPKWVCQTWMFMFNTIR